MIPFEKEENSTFDVDSWSKIELRSIVTKGRDWVVLEGHWKCCGGVGLQRWWRKMNPFASWMILPFHDFLQIWIGGVYR